MEPPDNERVKAVFQAALERTTQAERAALLDQACDGDAALRGRVDALLQAHDKPDPLLDRPAVGLLETQGDAPGVPPGDDAATADDDGDDWLDFLAPPSKPDSLGRLGHYEVLDVAGRGGMGIVFRAFDEKLRRVVAIKALAPALAAGPQSRRRFVREAQAAAAVTHENVIAIYEVEDAGPVPYLVMQFIDGVSLQQKIDRTGPLPLKAVLRIGLHIAQGLAAAHRQGLVHRDVKPANILLENGVERVKITDFGLARAGGDDVLTQAGVFTGTPAYVSPEQAKGEAVDARSDLFSLGSVLYAMCTGRPPFAAPSVLAALKRVCEEPPRPLRQVNAEMPPWLEGLVSRLLAKAPADRPAAAAEVADLLAWHLAELQHGAAAPSAAAETPAPRRPAGPVRWSLRRRLTAAAVLLGGALAALLVIESMQAGGIRAAWDRTIRQANAPTNGPAPTAATAPAATNPAVAAAGDPRPDPAAVAATAAQNEWERKVATLPPDEQARAVVERLRELNPGFDGPVKHVSTGPVVTMIEFTANNVSDLSPVRALKGLETLNAGLPGGGPGPLADLSPLRGMHLTTLRVPYTRVPDLSPLKGMKLTLLDCSGTAVSDLGPIRGMPLEFLFLSNLRQSDLSALRGMRLKTLMLEGTPVSDVSPLQGMPLTYLSLYHTRVRDLSPLKESPLEFLNLAGAPVSDVSALKDVPTLRRLLLDGAPLADLSPLKDLSLEWLSIHNTRVTDLSPLEGMPLRQIGLDFQAPRDVRVLRSLTGLKTINDKPAAEFWKEHPLPE